MRPVKRTAEVSAKKVDVSHEDTEYLVGLLADRVHGSELDLEAKRTETDTKPEKGDYIVTTISFQSGVYERLFDLVVENKKKKKGVKTVSKMVNLVLDAYLKGIGR